jgi:hypothetical protein
LSVDPARCIRSHEAIIFWPEFGSKTDSYSYRQSGWKLLNNNENTQLNPKYWIETAITTLKNRREIANTSNLFVTVRGTAKPASRTIIAGWIKQLFKEAEINFTPGSIRSAVASKNWFHYPLDEVLARGNWRSANTFRNFYKREILSNMPKTVSKNITELFNPVD